MYFIIYKYSDGTLYIKSFKEKTKAEKILESAKLYTNDKTVVDGVFDRFKLLEQIKNITF